MQKRERITEHMVYMQITCSWEAFWDAEASDGALLSWPPLVDVVRGSTLNAPMPEELGFSLFSARMTTLRGSPCRLLTTALPNTGS